MGSAIGLLLMVGLEDSLVVLLDYLLGNALHSKDLDVEADAVGQGIVNGSESFFVDLTHVHAQTCCALVVEASRAGLDIPPAVLSLRPQRSHLKCFAF